MKSLVVFYSLEDHTKLIADILSKELGCDLLELKPEKEFPKTGLKKYFWGGKSALSKEKPNLQNSLPDLKEYDTIFIGTPIWAGTYTPAINTFISDTAIHEKNIALFACHAGGGAKKCFDQLKLELKDNLFLGTIDFKNPAEADKEKLTHDIKEWLSNIIK